MTPPALAPFLAFPAALRQAGIPAAPEQTESFIAATGLLGPTSFADIRHAAYAVFGPGPERRDEFDQVFDTVFLGRAFAAPAESTPEDMPNAYEGAEFEPLLDADSEEPSGAEATTAERLTARMLDGLSEDSALRAFVPRCARCPSAPPLPAQTYRQGSPCRPRPGISRDAPPRRRIDATAHAPPHSAAASRAFVGRCVWIDEGGHRRRNAVCAFAGAGGRASGGVHAWDPADTGDSRVAPSKPRTGADLVLRSRPLIGTAGRDWATRSPYFSRCLVSPHSHAARWW